MNKIDRRVRLLLFILILLILPGFTQEGKDGFNRYYFMDGTFHKVFVTTLNEYFYFMDNSTFGEIDWDKLNHIVLASKQEKIELAKKEREEKEKQQAAEATESSKTEESTNSEQSKVVNKPTDSNNQTTESNKEVEEKQQPNQQKTTNKEEKQEPKEEIKQEPKKEQNTSTNNFEQEVVRLTNIEREKNGLPPLKLDSKLAEVAQKKSEDMAINQYFSHQSPTYGSPFDMMNSFGITYYSAGENIAKGQQTPEDVVQAWMNSEGHRANILSTNFTHIGVGFEKENRIWTQQFIGK